MIAREVYEQSLRQLLAPIARYLDDATVSEVLINGPAEIFVERRGTLSRVSERFERPEDLLAALRAIAQYCGRPWGEHASVLEARLPDGSRVQAVLGPAAHRAPCVAVRRFSRATLTIERLIDHGALSSDAAAALALLVEHKQNLIVAGGTGSGKTSILNALGAFVPRDERVVVIEDGRELQLQGHHVVQLEAQAPDPAGRGGVNVRELFRATLRLRPDRIVVGEVRGGEALDLIQAMTSGHGGCMSTVHASTPIDALHRLETLALMGGVELPLSALRTQVASAVDIIVQTARRPDGTRCITEIVEVVSGAGSAGHRIAALFRRARGRQPTGEEAAGELVATGVLPRCAELVHATGRRFPAGMYTTGGTP